MLFTGSLNLLSCAAQTHLPRYDVIHSGLGSRSLKSNTKQSQGNPEEEEGRLQEPKGSRTPEEHQKNASTKPGSQGLTETEAVNAGWVWVRARSAACTLQFRSLVLLWDPQQWKQGASLTLLPMLRTLFLLQGCLTQPGQDGSCPVFVHLVKHEGC